MNDFRWGVIFGLLSMGFVWWIVSVIIKTSPDNILPKMIGG